MLQRQHKGVLLGALLATSIVASKAQSNPQPVPSGTLTPTVVSVSSTATGAIPAVAPFIGLSYEKTQLATSTRFFSSSNTRAVGVFKRLGVGVLRIGGNSVDNSTAVWTPNGAGQTANQISKSDIDALATFVAATGWKVLYGISFTENLSCSPNLGSSSCQVNAAAADEAAYVTQALGSHLIGFEIGNEPDGYISEGYVPSTYTPSIFAAQWNQLASAIHNSLPNAVFTGPALGIANNVTKWTTPFMAENSSQVSLITQHYYIGAGSTGTMSQMLASSVYGSGSYYSSMVSQMNTLRETYTQVWRLAETNNFYNGGAAGVSSAYGSALWALDHYFETATVGAAGINYISGGEPVKTPYTPINDVNGYCYGPMPEYYGIYFASLANSGSLLATSISAGGVNATAYTVKDTVNNSYNTVIINKDTGGENLDVQLSLPGNISSASILVLTDTAATNALADTTNMYVQGAQVGKDGSFTPGASYTTTPSGATVSVYVPAFSAVLVKSIPVGSL